MPILARVGVDIGLGVLPDMLIRQSSVVLASVLSEIQADPASPPEKVFSEG